MAKKKNQISQQGISSSVNHNLDDAMALLNLAELFLPLDGSPPISKGPAETNFSKSRFNTLSLILDMRTADGVKEFRRSLDKLVPGRDHSLPLSKTGT